MTQEMKETRHEALVGLARLVGTAALSAALLVLVGACSGGLFPTPIDTAVEPAACGSSAPRYAPYFTASPSSGYAPLAVSFSSNGPDVVEWHWTFGDGQTSALPAPTHTYAYAGTYTVTLTVIRPDGGGTRSATWSSDMHIQGKRDLVIASVAHTPEFGASGTSLVFSIVVRNDGTATSTSARVTVRGARTRGSVGLPHLAPGQSATVAVPIRMSRGPETFTIEATLLGGSRDAAPGNNRTSHTVTLGP